MKRDIFQTVTALIIQAILWLPILLPNSITKYTPSISTELPLFNIWGTVSIVLMMAAAAMYTVQLMGKLYDYLRK